MKKKILIFGVLAVMMLVTISYATAVETEATTQTKESPLFAIRAKRAIIEQIDMLKENIKSNFMGNRILWLPLTCFQNKDITLRQQFCITKLIYPMTSFQSTCAGDHCTFNSATCAAYSTCSGCALG